MSGSESFGQFFGFAAAVLFLAIILGLLIWGIKLAAKDAVRRGKSPVLVSIACVLFFPWGLVAWILFRPDPIDKGKDGFELKNYRVQ